MNRNDFVRTLLNGASASALAAALSIVAAGALAGSLPTDGRYVAGSGKMQNSAGGLTIDQSSSNGIIDWQSFSIGAGKTVQFDNGRGATLNEVTGNNLSQIAGSLKATGSVYLVNPSGIIVTPGGKVITQGSFAASSAGNVINNGSISSPNGQVSLISDGHGNVINTGNIAAAQVELNAAGGNVYALAGNNGGMIRATGTASRAGHVWLTAGGTTTISGSLSAGNANGTGGAIVATGKSVNVGATANLNASGTRGGTILIGGDVHGGAITSDDFVPQKVADAQTTKIAKGARISANGSAGRGGKVVVWSNQATNFAGTISARGARATSGGFAEVSSHDLLAFNGHVDLTAAFGRTGTLLLDPYNVTISTAASQTETCTGGVCTPSGNNSILNVGTLESLLASTNVDVTTGSSGKQTGDITIDAALTWSSANTLTLDAYHSVLVNDPISVTGTGGLDIVTNDGGTGGTFLFGPSGDVTFADLSSALTINGAAYTLVNNISTLATDIAAKPTGDFALADSYNASGNGTYTEAPIQTTFYGIFDGLGNTIKNLSINDTAVAQAVGLFAVLYTGGEITNIGLSNASVQAGEDPYAGTLVGLNYGLVLGDNASGSLSQASGQISGIFGGLVGYNVAGLIENSSASTTVSCQISCRAGGLTGFNIEGSGIDISNSFASGNVSGGESSEVGGLAGESENSGINGSYATGNVTGGSGATVGGLVGYAASGSIADSYASGIVEGGEGSGDGGLIGGNDAKISGSYAMGAVSGLNDSSVGGLIGYNFGKIGSSYATGAVIAGDDGSAGGLIGYNFSTVAKSYASGTVTDGTGYEAYAGGLIGWNVRGNISSSDATGAVTDGDLGTAGGLVGYVQKGNITGSYATGAVSGGYDAYAGGLVGEDPAGSIGNSHATGNVTGGDDALMGGLVGYTNGAISSSYATGNLSGGIGSEGGGLAGESDNKITGSYAEGSVTCTTSCDAAGLVGSNYGTISNSYATGNSIAGNYSNAGGLVGGNEGTITESYATGSATVGNGIGGVGGGLAGGLAAENDGTISESFATGAASGGSVTSVGGLVGFNLCCGGGANGTIENSYATGSATGGANSWIGGLVGFNDYGTISDSYSTGAPTGGSGADVGGLVGADYGTDTDNYWDTTTSGITNLSQGAGNIANYAGITGLTTTQLQSGLPAGFSSSIWGESSSINGGLPYLLNNEPPISAPARRLIACGGEKKMSCVSASKS